ncbi:DUF7344 domain-containing protein [Haloarcula litorea]|uniref:DUF7344 domain-containing protein n=1 Tax=Haloarcula litorea TaxID=3032579 RepID=UPI0023E7A0A2|nr:helix-turn-helix domain-containing protein [Halomicroarcula sp. GDY20]
MSDAPPADDLFRALASETRRDVLEALQRRESIPLDELADTLVGRGTTSGPADVDERAQTKIELVHAHVPLLVDAGLVAHDESAGEVSLTTLPEPVEELLTFAAEYERSRRRHR